MAISNSLRSHKARTVRPAFPGASLRRLLERLEERDVPSIAGLDGHEEHDHSPIVGPLYIESHVRTDIIDNAAFQFTWDPPKDEAPDPGKGPPSVANALNPLTSIPQLHSNPGAPATLYLDFDGHFDSTWGGYQNITTPVFDQDNDPTTFSDAELTTMQEIWKLVAEDYASFRINVTTVQPASFANKVGLRVAIGGDGAWSGGVYGGIAYINSFTSSIVNTVYVFTENLGNGFAKYTGEASSHEAGHAFGLQHQSQYDGNGTKIAEYYGGSGDGRAPIMGVSYYVPRGLWWYGTSAIGPTSFQDDMSVISNTTNGFGYRTDDNTTAIPLVVAGRDISGSGIIERTTDQDVFTFTASAGEMNLLVNVVPGIGNLNARLELRDAVGNLLAASDPSTYGDRRTIAYAAAGGSYRLVVASHGGYGDVGQFTVSGTIAVPSTINAPSNLAATNSAETQIDLTWADNAGNEDGYTVDRSSDGGATWTTLATLPADSTGYADATVLPGTTYNFRVSAYNAGDVSPYSNQAIATTVTVAPGVLKATAVWYNRAYLTWGNVTGETGFRIERSADGGGTWAAIGSVAVNVLNYHDLGLAAESTYSYRVTATNDGGNSAFTNLASATTLAVPPSSFGSEEGAFAAETWSGRYNDVAIQPADQSIVAAGIMYGTVVNPPSSDYRIAVARYNSAGAIDASYGTGGVSAPVLGTSLEYGYGLALQSDGKAVVAGQANSLHAVARFNANGSLDSAFGNGGLATVDVLTTDSTAPAIAVGLQSTGRIVIGGSVVDFSTTVDPAMLARFTTSGGLDSGGGGGFGQSTNGFRLSSFGGNTNVFSDLVVQPDNKIVAVGYSSSDANGGLLVARYSANGALDTTFNTTGYAVLLPAGATVARAFGLTLQADGKIVIAGSCTGIDGASDLLVTRVNANGTVDTSFGSGTGFVRFDVDGIDSVTTEAGADVAVQPNGRIVVAGTLVSGTEPADLLVVRVTSDGTADSSFAAGGFKIGSLPSEMGTPRLFATRVALQADRGIVVSGYGNWSPTGTSNVQFIHPVMMRFLGDPTAVVTPTSGLITTEAGGQAAFTVTLSAEPTADVVIPISSSDTTEGIVSAASLTFTQADWNVPQTVTITGVDDATYDGNVAYSIVLGAATSADGRFSGVDPSDVSVSNTDNDVLTTKFYVVNDASTNVTYEYASTGVSVENYAMNSGNSAPRGVASTAVGDKVWVVDDSRRVYVYNPGGSLLGSWTVGTLANNATPQGIATNGIDVWIVDSRNDRVYLYSGAATRLSGSQNAASSFALNNSNTSPTDVVTDGSSLWVTNDSSTNRVFKYSLSGTLQGSWTIDAANGTPTGIAIDPANVSTIWIVDSGTDRVYEYAGAATRTSGSQSAAASFALAAGNTNPQGIADPPSRSGTVKRRR